MRYLGPHERMTDKTEQQFNNTDFWQVVMGLTWSEEGAVSDWGHSDAVRNFPGPSETDPKPGGGGV